MTTDHLVELYLDGLATGIAYTLRQFAPCESKGTRHLMAAEMMATITGDADTMRTMRAEIEQKARAAADGERTDDQDRRLCHAVPRALQQDMRNGTWVDPDAATLCGLPPGDVGSVSVTARFVTCPECRAAEGFALLADEVRA